MRIERFRQDGGSVLVEVVTFAVVGFGLVLTLGLSLLEQERKVLELQSITRNAMRAYLLDPSTDIFDEVSRQQDQSRLLAEEPLSVSVSCSPTNCSTPNAMIWLEVEVSGLDSKAFGISSG